MEPWRTVRSQEGLGAARRFLFVSVIILAAYSAWLIYESGSLTQGGLAIGLATAIVAFGTIRYGGERLEVHPWGVVVAKLWKTQQLLWQDIAEVFIVIAHKDRQEEPPTMLLLDGESQDTAQAIAQALSDPEIVVRVVGVYRWPDLGAVTAPVAGKEAAHALAGGITAFRAEAI